MPLELQPNSPESGFLGALSVGSPSLAYRMLSQDRSDFTHFPFFFFRA